MQDKFVFFDLGNVLVHFDHDIAVANVAQLLNRDAALVKQALFTSGLQDQLETGLISSSQFIETLVQTLECRLRSDFHSATPTANAQNDSEQNDSEQNDSEQNDSEQNDSELGSHPLLEAISAIFQPNDGIIAVLEQLKRAGVPMAVLSNTCEPHWQWIQRQNWAVMQGWFDFHVLSYDARSMKPDAIIYQVCEERSGRRPSQLFFTDDRIDNVAAARARGWHAHQFMTVELLAKELGEWLGIRLDSSPRTLESRSLP